MCRRPSFQWFPGFLQNDSRLQFFRVSVMYFVHQLLFCTHTLGGICYSQNELTIELIRLRMARDTSLALFSVIRFTWAYFQHTFYICARVQCEQPASFHKARGFYVLRSRAPSRRQKGLPVPEYLGFCYIVLGFPWPLGSVWKL